MTKTNTPNKTPKQAPKAKAAAEAKAKAAAEAKAKAAAEAKAKAAAEAKAKAAARRIAEELTRAPANEIPDGKRWGISKATQKKVQRLPAAHNGRLHKEFTARWVAGDLYPGTHDEIAHELACARRKTREITQAQYASAYESVCRVRDAEFLKKDDRGVYTLVCFADIED